MISAVLVVASGIQSASAQTKYNTWSDPSTPATSSGQQATGDLQKFVDDLNKLSAGKVLEKILI